jgi:hypothetical protein
VKRAGPTDADDEEDGGGEDETAALVRDALMRICT